MRGGFGEGYPVEETMATPSEGAAIENIEPSSLQKETVKNALAKWKEFTKMSSAELQAIAQDGGGDYVAGLQNSYTYLEPAVREINPSVAGDKESVVAAAEAMVVAWDEEEKLEENKEGVE